MKRLTLLFLLCLTVCRATNYYVTQAGTSPYNGSITNPWRASDFLNSANWSTTIGTSGKISPDDTVYLAGNITTALSTQGPGTSGHMINIVAQAGCKLTNPTWGAGGVAFSINHNYIHADGANVGIIETTANGTGLANLDSNSAFVVTSAHDVIIENWTIGPMFKRVKPAAGDSTSGQDACGIFINSSASNCNNFLANHNSITDAANGIVANYGSGAHDIVYTNNTVANVNWSYNIGDRGNSGDSITGAIIANNSCSGWSNWNDDNPDYFFHHNGVFLFNNNSVGVMASPLVANNYFGPGLGGAHQTATIFINGNITNPTLVGNRFAPAADEASGNGAVTIGGLYNTTTVNLYNNTLNQGGTNPAGVGVSFNNTYNNSIVFNLRNNVFVGPWFYNVNYISGSNGTLNANHNLYYNAPTFSVGAGNENIAAWKSLGFDTDMITTNPLFVGGGNYHLQTGSPARSAGVNLTSLGISALNTDGASVVRPTSGAWDIGAFQDSGGGGGGDTTAPTPNPATIASTSHTSSSVSVTATTATDETSLGSAPYRFSKDNGSTWSAYQLSASYTWTGLTVSTAYQVKVQYQDAASNAGTASSATTVTTDASAPASNPVARLRRGASGL